MTLKQQFGKTLYVKAKHLQAIAAAYADVAAALALLDEQADARKYRDKAHALLLDAEQRLKEARSAGYFVVEAAQLQEMRDGQTNA